MAAGRKAYLKHLWCVTLHGGSGDHATHSCYDSFISKVTSKRTNVGLRQASEPVALAKYLVVFFL